MSLTDLQRLGQEFDQTHTPELLKALVRAADEFDLILQRLRDDQPERAQGAALCGARDARAAIAKATA